MLNNKKLLCLGNNTEDTDIQAQKIASQHNLLYYGLITEIDQIANFANGCYQTSYYDIQYGDLIKLANQFDEVIILEQAKETYIDEHGFFQTISLGKKIKHAKFIDPTFNNTFEDILVTNKSFCILPFIQSVVINGSNYPCCRANNPLSVYDPAVGYLNDNDRNIMKQKMIDGKLNTHCKVCYDLEDKGVISPRIQQTIEWTNRLNLKTFDDLNSLTYPRYYEIRASNQCNLMCRMCSPQLSNLIAKENKTLKLFNDESMTYTGFETVDIRYVDKLYVAGGEPTIMLEFHNFLQNCIANNQTAFELQINTNAVSLSDKFKSLIKQFSNCTFEISIDGYELVNQYIRWPTKWSKLINNVDYLYREGHKISFNSVVSIYNIASLDKIIEFLSNRYRHTTIHLALVVFEDDILSPYLYPDRQTVINSLTKITELEVYKNNLILQSQIDEYLDYFKNRHKVNLKKLARFFEYNDKLDLSRSVKLIDYIPELDACRN